MQHNLCVVDSEKLSVWHSLCRIDYVGLKYSNTNQALKETMFLCVNLKMCQSGWFSWSANSVWWTQANLSPFSKCNHRNFVWIKSNRIIRIKSLERGMNNLCKYQTWTDSEVDGPVPARKMASKTWWHL